MTEADGKRPARLRPLFTWRSEVASERGPRSPTTRHVLLTLSLHMSELGDSCWPSTRSIAAETNLSQRAVIEHLRQAEADGWITRQERKKPGNGWRAYEYFAAIPHADRASSPGDYPASAPRDDGRSSPGAYPDAGRAYPDDVNVLTDGQLSTSVNSSRGSARTRGAAPERVLKMPMPESWGPAQEVYRWAFERNISDQEIRGCLEAFTLNARAKGTQVSDWNAYFMSWLLKEKKFAFRGARGPAHPPRRKVDTQCRWTNGGTEPRCEAEGTVCLGSDQFLCGKHSGEYSKLLERARGKATRPEVPAT